MKSLIQHRFLLFFFAITTQAFSQVPIERPALQPGDTWTYQRTNLWGNQPQGTSKISVVSIHNGMVSFEGQGFSGRSFKEVKNLDLNTVNVIKGADVISGGYQWPLVVGKTVKFKTPWVNASNSEGQDEGECANVELETVKVPAGEFATIKIVCTAFWTNYSNGGTGRWENTLWYAPAVKRVVKNKNILWLGARLDRQTQDELLEYKLSQ